MARDLDGSDDFLANTGGAPATAAPLTIACWFKADTLPGTSCLLSLYGQVSSNSVSMVVEDTPKKLKIRVNGGANVVAIHGTTVATGTWYHACGVLTSTTSRDIYLDGASPVNNTTSQTPTGINRVYLGVINGSAFDHDGQLAEAGVWNVALSAAEVASLAKGFSPRLIRPESLMAYWPLLGRVSPEPDLKGGYPLTITGTVPYADHPRIIYPTKRRFYSVPAAGGGGTENADGSSAGVGAASGVGASTAASVASSAGVGAASGTGVSTAASVADSAGAGAASSVGASTFAGIGSSAGIGAASGVGESTFAGIGSSAGIGAASGVGASTFAGIGSSAGIGAASGVSESTTSGAARHLLLLGAG